VHAWVVRAVALLCAIANLLLLERLAWRLSGSQRAARDATWLLLGTASFAVLATAVMFDVLLTAFVLLALHGVLDLSGIPTHGRWPGRCRWQRGVLFCASGIGLGILAKGPVVLVHVAFAALLAPIWCPRPGWRPGRYYGGLLLALAIGAGIALAWAIPAALRGGEAYAHAIFLHQTLGRVSGSFAHRHGIGWYLMVLPLLVLPWPLALRTRWAALKGLAPDPAIRFALAWCVPTLVVFSLISGKQAHYLVPLLPGIALLSGVALDRQAVWVRSGLTAVALVVVGVIVAALPQLATRNQSLAIFVTTRPLWGVLIVGCGLGLWILRRRYQGLAPITCAVLATVLVAKAAFVHGTGERYDVSRVAAEVRRIQDRGQPLVHIGWHHGAYAFAGRLDAPLPEIGLVQLPVWARAHPDGLVMSFSKFAQFRATPLFEQPFRGRRVAIWNARDAVAAGRLTRDGEARDDEARDDEARDDEARDDEATSED
jgi:4-amino-4-deoxy-L-arabinose transferase-like glycosyltransferase